MRITNTTEIPNEIIRDVIRFTRPPGIHHFRITVTKYRRYAWRGRGHAGGITVRINQDWKYPMRLHTYQYGQLRGRRYYLGSVIEGLIYVIAHELMHTRQGQKGAVRGRVWGARGRFSEIECESYAIKKLREWRSKT